jgi:hypothetical protein
MTAYSALHKVRKTKKTVHCNDVRMPPLDHPTYGAQSAEKKAGEVRREGLALGMMKIRVL